MIQQSSFSPFPPHPHDCYIDKMIPTGQLSYLQFNSLMGDLRRPASTFCETHIVPFHLVKKLLEEFAV